MSSLGLSAFSLPFRVNGGDCGVLVRFVMPGLPHAAEKGARLDGVAQIGWAPAQFDYEVSGVPVGREAKTHEPAHRGLNTVAQSSHPILQTGSPASALRASAGHEERPPQQVTPTVYARRQAA